MVARNLIAAALAAAAAALAVPGLPAASAAVGLPAVPGPPPPPVAPSVFLAPPTTTVPDPAAPTPADTRAGILRRVVARSGDGEFTVVPGSAPAPRPGEAHPVRVEVEHGLPVDGARFADFVLETLNDPRSWGPAFSRTDGGAPLTVRLATPDTSAELCDDVDGGGELSCRNGPVVVLTFARWVTGTDEYSGDLTGYRRYVVNHEVGHWLGHGHELCPGRGRPAPVMQQQTLGLKGCTPNSWPHP